MIARNHDDLDQTDSTAIRLHDYLTDATVRNNGKGERSGEIRPKLANRLMNSQPGRVHGEIENFSRKGIIRRAVFPVTGGRRRHRMILPSVVKCKLNATYSVNAHGIPSCLWSNQLEQVGRAAQLRCRSLRIHQPKN